MDTKIETNKKQYTLEEAIEWLHDTLGYLTEEEQEGIVTPFQLEFIVQVAEKASNILESAGG